MMSVFQGMVNSESFIQTFIVILLIAYFVYKEWPEFKKRVSKGSVSEKEQEYSDASLATDIKNIKNDIAELKDDITQIKERQTRDYNRMNQLEMETERQKKAIIESLEERKMLMRGLIASLDGLEQLGCNHTVTETKKAISDYLNEVAHVG